MRKQSRINMLVLITLVFTVSGCGVERIKVLIGDVKTLSELGSRQVESAVILLFEDLRYAIRPLLKRDGLLLVQASRTKGSKRHELRGVSPSSGETLWRYELQSTKLMGWGSDDFGTGTWTIAPVGDRLAVIQVISEGDEALLDYAVVDILDVQEGTIVIGTKTPIDDDHWMGTALTKGRAYLSIRNLYSVDLETGTVDWEWPLSAPLADLIDPLGE